MKNIHDIKIGQIVQVLSVDQERLTHLIGSCGVVERLNDDLLAVVRFSNGDTIDMYVGRFKPVQAKPSLCALEKQVGGDHYKKLGVQPMELVLANMGFIAFEGACYTKINKYMIRHKDDKVEQLKKARHVLDMWIEEAEKQQC